MPETILLAFIYSKYKKYQISPLFRQKEIYYVLSIELIYIIMQLSIFNGSYTAIKYAGILKSVYLCSYLGLILKHELYKEAILGSGCILLGGLCNRIAIIANGGKMPVFPYLSYLTGYIKPGAFEMANEVANDFHILGSADTNLIFLTDIFDIGYSILSIGDLFIRVFIMIVIYSSIKQLNHSYTNIKIYP